MDKLKYIKLENEDGSYSDAIPLAVDADHVDVNGQDLTSVLSTKVTQSEISLISNDLEIQKSRIDNLAQLEEGSTTGDAELIDIRTGFDGISYNNAGDAVREQINTCINTVVNTENIYETNKGYNELINKAKDIPDNKIYMNEESLEVGFLKEITLYNIRNNDNAKVFLVKKENDVYKIIDTYNYISIYNTTKTLLVNWNIIEKDTFFIAFDYSIAYGNITNNYKWGSFIYNNNVLTRSESYERVFCFCCKYNYYKYNYSLQSDINSLQSDINNLQTDVDNLQTDVDNLFELRKNLYKNQTPPRVNSTTRNTIWVIDEPLLKNTILESININGNFNSQEIIFYLFSYENNIYTLLDSKTINYIQNTSEIVLNWDLTEYNKDIFLGWKSTSPFIHYDTIDQKEGISFSQLDNNFTRVFHWNSNFLLNAYLLYRYNITMIKEDVDKLDTRVTLLEESESLNSSTVLTVSKDGTKNFTTINQALTYAYTIESRQNPITILIYPGVYSEVCNIKGNHFISLVGINRDTCIIRDDTGDYNNAPVRIEGNSYIANLSLISTYKNNSNFIVNNTITVLPSYALHIDDRHADDDNEYKCTVYNCYLYSEQNPAVGIGLDKNQIVELNNCEIITNKSEEYLNSTALESNWAYKPNGGALFYHALYNGSYTDSNGYQKLIVKNCIIRCNSRNIGFGESGGLSNKVELEFINNTGWSEVNGATFIKGLSDAIISPLSCNNNFTNMNYINE